MPIFFSALSFHSIGTFFLEGLAVVGAFLLVICAHELGHFFMARFFHVSVLRLNLGFGKPMWSKKSKKGLEYSISPFLLGGYVKLLDEREGIVPEALLSHSMTRQSAWKRLCILAAGPVMNFIFAFFLFIAPLLHGLPVLKPVIGEVISGSLAEKVGFQKGDVFLAVQDKAVSDWVFVNFALLDAFGEKGQLSVDVQRPEHSSTRLIAPLASWKLNPLYPNLLTSLGIRPALDPRFVHVVKAKPWQALRQSMVYVSDYASINAVIAYKLVRGILSIRSLAGPISVFMASVENMRKGWVYYCFFLGFLSVSVGVFNLLPIPGLDGFQMLIVVIEKIRGRPVSSALQVLLYQLGLIALSLLFVQVLTNDMTRYGKFF